MLKILQQLKNDYKHMKKWMWNFNLLLKVWWNGRNIKIIWWKNIYLKRSFYDVEIMCKSVTNSSESHEKLRSCLNIYLKSTKKKKVYQLMETFCCCDKKVLYRKMEEESEKFPGLLSVWKWLNKWDIKCHVWKF